MSPEEATREKQMRDREMSETAAAEQGNERVASWRTSASHRRSLNASAAPPMPSYHPPPAPVTSGQLSPAAHKTMERAEQEAQRTEQEGANEDAVPDKILSTTATGERRESGQAQPVLPVVEEAAEARSLGSRGRDDDQDFRPRTPAKDDRYSSAKNFTLRTPQKNLKPDSQDSAHDEEKIQPRLSKDSLNKDLPPLPIEASHGGRSRSKFA